MVPLLPQYPIRRFLTAPFGIRHWKYQSLRFVLIVLELQFVTITYFNLMTLIKYNYLAFQSINGHIICSSCLAKVNNKCPACRSCVMLRSRVMDMALEVIQLKCKNSEQGCQKTMSFGENKDHERTCQCAPCACPLLDCNFLGSASQLYLYFSWKNGKTFVSFTYKKRVKVTQNVNDSVFLFREQKNGHLFSLKNVVAG